MRNKKDKIKPTDVFGYHIFPPFIDAYVCSFLGDKLKTLSEIKDIMEGHAFNWGYESIGKSFLKGFDLPKYNDKIVVCCGRTYLGEYNDIYKEYLIVIDEFCYNWYDKLEFIEGEIEPSWDVT